MGESRAIAGVVLVGGQSKRMGQNKAFLDFRGRALVDHMVGLLKNIGVKDVILSGTLDGYHYIPDNVPFSGPAQAMLNIMSIKPDYTGYLFIPVDMPLLTGDILKILLSQERSAYFKEYPMPAFIKKGSVRNRGITSVKELLESVDSIALPLPDAFLEAMKNTNTPDEWKEVTALS